MDPKLLRAAFPFLLILKVVEFFAGGHSQAGLARGPLKGLAQSPAFQSVARVYYEWQLHNLTWVLFFISLLLVIKDKFFDSASPLPAAPDYENRPRRQVVPKWQKTADPYQPRPGMGVARPAGGSRNRSAAKGPASAVSTFPVPTRPQPLPARRSLWPFLLMGFLLLVLGGGAALYVFREQLPLPEGMAESAPEMLQQFLQVYGLWIGIGVAALLLFFSGMGFFQRRFLLGIPSRKDATTPDRAEREQASALMARGKTLKAAQIYFRHLQDAQAVRLLLQGGCFQQAGDFYRSLGDNKRALKLLLRAGKPGALSAAEILSEQGDTEAAKPLFQQAAEHAREQKQFTTAARCYQKSGDPESAAQMLDGQIQEQRKAGDNPKQAPLRDLIQEACELFLEIGQSQKAATLYLLAGLYGPAGDVFSSLGLDEQAAEVYLQGALQHQAADAFERAGQAPRAAALRAAVHEQAGEHEAAAAQYELAEQFEKAAQLYQDLGQIEVAVRLFEQAGQPEPAARLARDNGLDKKAGELFAKAGQFSEAALCFRKSQDYSDAARYFQQAGSPTQAAEALLQDEKPGEAIRLLTTLDRQSPDFRQGQLLLAQAYARSDRTADAVACYQAFLDEARVSQENVEHYYQLASLLEELGDLAMSAKYFEKILVRHYNYQDAAQRFARLQDSQKQDLGRQVAGQVAGQLSNAFSGSVVHPTVDVQASSADSRYEISREIGRGGMGVVYQATDKALDRPVAFKILSTGVSDFQEALRNFEREAKLSARLNHPNIVSIYDYGVFQGKPFIAMEYVEGRTLAWIISGQNLYLQQNLKPLFQQIGAGLHHAHQTGLVHRDIKPQNIMLSKKNIIKIMDFGLAKLSASTTRSQVIKGTPLYMAPEQISNKQVDARTDIYALGIVLYNIATGGSSPFMQDNIIVQHVIQEPPPPTDFNPGISPQLEQLILQCLKKNPEERPETVAHLIRSLFGIKTLFHS